MSTSQTLKRTTFQTGRLLEFFSEQELQMQIGFPKEQWPIVIYGSQAEPLEPDDLVLVTGRLSWRAKTSKAGAKEGKLTVVSFGVAVLSREPTAAVSTNEPEGSTDARSALGAVRPRGWGMSRQKKRSRKRAASRCFGR